eukprot:CAMPEP_0183729982 /NCGR_PEP_ID=MMETSP0737-20130205/31648_1 /TAXON_ID=385413 /ORGANISM="Thalassiosira miniscula, Strain CCMP1093" /LENGTH=290 /DNA_ID=CAMNT_0025962319 /DNA_START=361 /DNA_END=1233 /DNA_ORIENTATION=-
MAGHNKWSKIKRKKAANDVARAKDHTKAARAIEVASRACQGDRSDIQLQSCIAAARAVQLPKERMERAIERGANPQMAKDGGEYVVRRYDGMVPTGDAGKVAVIIETLTENRNRTAANVRHLVTRTGGELLPTGANEWLFEHVGLIWVSRFMRAGDNIGGDGDVSGKGSEVDGDALLECALDGGASDVEFLEESDNSSGENDNNDHDETDIYATIKCETNDMLNLVQALQSDGYVAAQFENQWVVKDEGNKISLDDTESAEKFEKFLSSMNEDLDVTNVFHNASFPDDDR